MKRSGLVKPIVTAVGILALSGVGLAQTPSESHRAASARAHEVLSSASCPLPRITKEKNNRGRSEDLAQQFADKNWAGFGVVRPFGYGGGYNTMCYQTVSSTPARPLVLYSVEYSMDIKNPTGENAQSLRRSVRRRERIRSSFGMAGRAQPVRWVQPAPWARKVQPEQRVRKPWLIRITDHQLQEHLVRLRQVGHSS